METVSWSILESGIHITVCGMALLLLSGAQLPWPYKAAQAILWVVFCFTYSDCRGFFAKFARVFGLSSSSYFSWNVGNGIDWQLCYPALSLAVSLTHYITPKTNIHVSTVFVGWLVGMFFPLLPFVCLLLPDPKVFPCLWLFALKRITFCLCVLIRVAISHIVQSGIL